MKDVEAGPLEAGVVTNRVNSYDSAGRATSTSVVVPQIVGVIGAQLAGTYTSTISYNPDGSVNTQSLPATGPVPAETLTTGYTAAGQPDTFTGTLGSTTATYVRSTQYLEWGTLSAMVFGTHTGHYSMSSFTTDPLTLRMTRMQLNREGTSTFDERTDLTYDRPAISPGRKRPWLVARLIISVSGMTTSSSSPRRGPELGQSSAHLRGGVW